MSRNLRLIFLILICLTYRIDSRVTCCSTSQQKSILIKQIEKNVAARFLLMEGEGVRFVVGTSLHFTLCYDENVFRWLFLFPFIHSFFFLSLSFSFFLSCFDYNQKSLFLCTAKTNTIIIFDIVGCYSSKTVDNSNVNPSKSIYIITWLY